MSHDEVCEAGRGTFYCLLGVPAVNAFITVGVAMPQLVLVCLCVCVCVIVWLNRRRLCICVIALNGVGFNAQLLSGADTLMRFRSQLLEPKSLQQRPRWMRPSVR